MSKLLLNLNALWFDLYYIIQYIIWKFCVGIPIYSNCELHFQPQRCDYKQQNKLNKCTYRIKKKLTFHELTCNFASLDIFPCDSIFGIDFCIETLIFQNIITSTYKLGVLTQIVCFQLDLFCSNFFKINQMDRRKGGFK